MVFCFLLFLFLWTSVSCCLNNYIYDKDRGAKWCGYYTCSTHVFIKPNINGRLRHWWLELEFVSPLVSDLVAWDVNGTEGSSGKVSIKLTPKKYMSEIGNTFSFDYIATFFNSQENGHIKCIQFCGTLVTGKMICDIDGIFSPNKE